MKVYKTVLQLTIGLVFLITFTLLCFAKIAPSNNQKQLKNYIIESRIENGLLIKKLDASKITDERLNKILKDTNLKNGVYGLSFSDENQYYILLNGVDTDYNAISIYFNGNDLNLSYKSQYSKGSQKKLLFLFEPKGKTHIDIINLRNNEKSDHFETIFVL